MEPPDEAKPETVDAFGWPRPRKTIGYRLFRFSWSFFLISTGTTGILKIFWSEERIGNALGPIALPLGFLYIVCFVYFINYLAATVVKNRIVRALWIFLLALIALMGGCAAMDYLGW